MASAAAVALTSIAAALRTPPTSSSHRFAARAAFASASSSSPPPTMSPSAVRIARQPGGSSSSRDNRAAAAADSGMEAGTLPKRLRRRCRDHHRRPAVARAAATAQAGIFESDGGRTVVRSSLSATTAGFRGGGGGGGGAFPSFSRGRQQRCRLSSAPQVEAAAADAEPFAIEAAAAAAPRKRLSEFKISEVLKAKHTLRWVEPCISKQATLREAIVVCIERKLSGMMVVDREETTTDKSREKGKVVGLLTSRDFLRILASTIKDGEPDGEVLHRPVCDFMTPLSQVIYGRPDETVGTCRSVMAKLGIKCLPILADGRVEGILTARDLADFFFDAKDLGGKKNYLTDVSERVGLASSTSMAEPPSFVQKQLALSHAPLFLNVGTAEYPHPFKSANGVGRNRRDYGPGDLASDPNLSEDAHFFREADLFDETNTKIQRLLYMGVADGVGSWREYDVDPRDFSRALMEGCDSILDKASTKCQMRDGGSDSGSEEDRKESCRMISPAELLARSYQRAKDSNVVGSSTACVALFDSVSHQLHFSNLGDSGIIVLRHIDSDVAGVLKRDRDTPRTERKSDLRVAFVSQQQLRSFNHPFQLGWTGTEIVDGTSSFTNVSDSCTSSIHILRGDIILMASDGLFDNVDIDDIAAIALQWEQDHGFIDRGGAEARGRRWEKGKSFFNTSAKSIQPLADALCRKARENSLDNSIDSPFALLAKDNDIMWSGGMPDDCTVIAMHVVGQPTAPH